MVQQGNLEEIKKLLVVFPSLARENYVKDIQNKPMTLLQYASYLLDIEMVEVISSYLSPEEIKGQLQEVEVDKGYDLKPLIEKIQQYIEKYNHSNDEQRTQDWAKEVGGAQKLIPAWLIFMWSEAGDEAGWMQSNFKNSPARQFVTEPPMEAPLLYWFNGDRNNGIGVGSTWAFYRGPAPIFILNSSWRPLFPSIEEAEHDKNCLENLLSLRIRQLNRFKSARIEEKPNHSPGFFAAPVNSAGIPTGKQEGSVRVTTLKTITAENTGVNAVPTAPVSTLVTASQTPKAPLVIPVIHPTRDDNSSCCVIC